MKTSTILYRFYLETAEDQDSQGNKILNAIKACRDMFVVNSVSWNLLNYKLKHFGVKPMYDKLVWTNLTLRQAQTLNKLVDENLSYQGRPARRFGWEEI